MNKPEALTLLRTQLAALYDDMADIRVVAADAGLTTAAIDWQGSAVRVWQTVLLEAHRQNLVAQLVELACEHYPAQAVSLRTGYQHYMTAAIAPVDPAEAAQGSQLSPPASHNDRQRNSWQRQLTNYRHSLRLIEERLSEFVLPSDIPLQYVREQERLLAKIAELEEKLSIV